MKATLKNDFHNTELNVMVPKSGILSLRQARRVRRELCGSDECCCGKVRGPQDVCVEEIPDPHTGQFTYRIWAE